jgi:hypothetical protein
VTVSASLQKTHEPPFPLGGTIPAIRGNNVVPCIAILYSNIFQEGEYSTVEFIFFSEMFQIPE